MAKPFCENRRGARCFAELFWTTNRESINGLVKQKKNKMVHVF